MITITWIFLTIISLILWLLYKEFVKFNEKAATHHENYNSNQKIIIDSLKNIEKDVKELDEIMMPAERRFRR